MAEPIRNKRLNDLASAPTPQNTPATAVSSFAGRGASSGLPSVSTIKEEDGGLGAFASNPALINMIQGKLGSLVGKSSGYIESLPQQVRDRISGLKGIQQKHDELEAKFQQDLLELEKKYYALYLPLYTKRSKVIAGETEPTAEEIESGKALEEEDEDEDDEEEEEEDEEQKAKDEDEDIKGIPQFWLTAIRNLPQLAESISDRDEEALAFLTDIRMNYLDKPGFALVFEFAPNPFFTNKTLTKSYFYQEELGYGGDFIYDHAEGDEINWTSTDSNLTVRVEKRKQRNKHTKATRTVEKTFPVESFFTFFSPPKPVDLASDDDEEGLEEYHEVEAQLEADYAVGDAIKEKLIPRAVDWYTGEALQYEEPLEELDEDEFGDEDDEDEDEDDEDEDEDDEEDDEDDEEDGESKIKGSKEAPQECKQQ